METSENIYETPVELNVYDVIPPDRNPRNGLKSSLQKQHLIRTVKLTCFFAVIILLAIGTVITVGLMELSVLEDDQKVITKTLNTLVQGIDSQNGGNNSSFYSSDFLKKLSVFEDDLKIISKTLNTLVQDISLNKLSFCSTNKGCENNKEGVSKFRCYKVETSDTLTWHGALQMCQNIGGFLAEVTDHRSEEFVRMVVANGDDIWLGASDTTNEGVWIWETSRKNMIISNWRAGEPNNVERAEHCLLIQHQWVDYPCSSKRGYVCQSDRDSCDGWM